MNVPDNLDSAYRKFFLKTEAGQYFMSVVQDMHKGNHTKAENVPELARDYVQRAKGFTEVLDHIASVSRKEKPKEKS